MASKSRTRKLDDVKQTDADKAEFIWTGSRQQVAKTNTAVIVLKGHQIVPEMQRQMSRLADRH